MEFHDTVPLGGDAAPAPRAQPAPSAGTPTSAASEPAQTLAVQFTGSGSEYFRIWIVNLLLTIVTLGLYFPFAKARRLRYFHGNTVVGGHALAFHGDPWKMLRGFLLMAVFGAAYVGAGHFSPTAGAVAAVLFALLWPALWQASLRFRLANTSWRGLRLRFGGSLGGAYAALLPLLLPLALIIAAGAVAEHDKPAAAAAKAADAAAATSAVETVAGIVVLLAMLAIVVLMPWLLARLKRFQHGHYQFASETSRLDARTRSFYGLFLRGFGVTLLPVALIGIAAAIMVPMLRGGGAPAAKASMVGAFVLLGLAYLLMLLLSQSYMTARMQDLVWGGTRSPRLRFSSRLRVRSLLGLQLKNLLLMLVTLGLYRPFAAVATARLRLQAVSLDAQGDIDQWTADAARRMHDASGDAAGDLFGIDIGL